MRRDMFTRLRAAVALGALLAAGAGQAEAKTKPGAKVTRVAKKAKKKVARRVVVRAPVVAAPTIYAPPAPPAPPPPIEDVADYRWIDDAEALANAFGESPPDFSFRFGADEDWAWQARDGHMMIVEPVADQRRSYFYTPGADYAFLIRDGYFSYGFTGDGLAVVYDGDGRLVPWRPDDMRSVSARRLFERGVALRRAARERRVGPTPSWADQGGFWATLLFDFGREREIGGWRRYRDLHRDDRHDDHRARDRRHDDERRERDERRRHGGDGAGHGGPTGPGAPPPGTWHDDRPGAHPGDRPGAPRPGWPERPRQVATSWASPPPPVPSCPSGSF